MPNSASAVHPPEVSVVLPVYNEEGAIADLVAEIATAFQGTPHEIVVVDDGSTDQTRSILQGLKRTYPQLRPFTHAQNAGQSRAIRSGVEKAAAPIIVTLDGDGQNPPHDAPKLVERLKLAPDLGMVQGRRAKRQDNASKRWASRLANGVRKRLLNDGSDDSGCGLKAIRRDVFLNLPYFDHMHRYMAALVVREGLLVAFEDVDHRHRTTGNSKYTNLGRLFAALSDLVGVMWLRSRRRQHGQVHEL